MKNLESFGAQELNAKEIRETEGGCWIIGAFLGSFLYAVVEDLKGNIDAFKAGFNGN